jgi:hypothetical protein
MFGRRRDRLHCVLLALHGVTWGHANIGHNDSLVSPGERKVLRQVELGGVTADAERSHG